MVVVVGRWCKPTLVFIFRPSVELNQKSGQIIDLFGTNLLVRVKLGYTPNFTFLSHSEVPYKFGVGVVVGGV